jgi:uncharacterized RDD family membrane protein YckC
MDEYSARSIHQFSYQPGGYQPGGYPPGGYAPGPGNYPYPGPQSWTPVGELANLGGRIVAYLIDRFLIGFLVGIILGIGYLIAFIIAVAGAATQTEAGSVIGGLGFMFILLLLVPVGLAAWLFNEVYLAGKNNGQTIGKRLMKIRIAKEDGTPFGYMDAFLRNFIGYWISSLACGLGFIWGLFDNRNQTWHDKIFHTVVVRA